MRTIALIFIFQIFTFVSYAQVPDIDISLKKDLILRKSAHYQEMIRCEQQKTANQDDYDVTYYALDLMPDPVTSILDGSVEVVGRVTTPTLEYVELNFWDGYTIGEIHPTDQSGVQLQHSRGNDLLTVILDRVYSMGESFRISIEYSGRPGDSGYYSFNFDTYGGAPMIWTMSSVFRARGWWPCKDVPSDKPDSIDVRVTVPSDLIAVSNGALRQTETIGNMTTYWWHEKYPIATYLVSVSIHPYEVIYDDYVYNNGTDTMQIHFYGFQGNYDANERINGLVKDMLTCYSGLFGEYPFVDEKYAQVDFLWGGGMEHQTCTSYGSWSEVLYAHEIGHQWWGDMITCDSFHHIWLNEGFASYAEALWFEWAYPPFSASEYQMMYQLYLGPGTVYVEHPEYEEIFDSGLSYVKGSWVLHMLRHVVGDTEFFNILRTYYASALHQYGTATTEGFQAVCEQVSGLDLEKFFHQWIHEEFYPVYSYSWTVNVSGSGYDIDLEIRQEQTNHIFWMPIDVTVTTSTGEQTFVVWDSLASQSFRLSTNTMPIGIELDRDDWILKRIQEPFVDPTFDQGILLVNGVPFDIYGDEIWNFYEDRAAWGAFPISYWDCFYPSLDDYPSTLPQPLGYGRVPGDILGRFSSVVWIGNDYGGDLGSWQQTSILPYLESGGNVLLITRKGQAYLDEDLREYLGIQWIEDPSSTLQDCEATLYGLRHMSFNGSQTSNAVFDTDAMGEESTLLFQETLSFPVPRGLGVWNHPADGGAYRSDGGHFVFISGRPYRYDTEHLRENSEFILTNFFHEGGGPGAGGFAQVSLEPNYPNPFAGSTTIRYFVSQLSEVTVRIFNIRGQMIASLVEGVMMSGGYHTISWDGHDRNGNRVSSDVYLVVIRSGDNLDAKKMVLLNSDG